MAKILTRGHGLPSCMAGGIALVVLFSAGLPNLSGQALPCREGPGAASPEVQVLTLAECRRLCLERQPAVAAQRASLASAEAGARGVDRLCVPAILAPDLPIRRQQAALGITIAEAALDQVVHETLYATTRTYYMVVYARQQQVVADEVVKNLGDALSIATKLIRTGGAPRDLKEIDVERNRAYLRLAETRQYEADRGILRSTAALREAIGLVPECKIQAKGSRLPKLVPDLRLEELVRLALTRRGEVIMAETASEITSLEVVAQGKVRRTVSPTFASGADLHVRPVPLMVNNSEYRPGAVGLEMPPNLVGHRSDRVARARALSERACAMVDKTRNLVALEAEDAHRKWDLAVQNMRKAGEAADAAGKVVTDSDDRFRNTGANYREFLEASVLKAQALAQYNEALFHHAIGLAAVEKVTAGGICIDSSPPTSGEQ